MGWIGGLGSLGAPPTPEHFGSLECSARLAVQCVATDLSPACTVLPPVFAPDPLSLLASWTGVVTSRLQLQVIGMSDTLTGLGASIQTLCAIRTPTRVDLVSMDCPTLTRGLIAFFSVRLPVTLLRSLLFVHWEQFRRLGLGFPTDNRLSRRAVRGWEPRRRHLGALAVLGDGRGQILALSASVRQKFDQLE
jgi:hypothetical protein